MARKWTTNEETHYRNQLHKLYVVQNKTINEIGRELGLAESSVFDRLRRLDIKSTPDRKVRYLNRRSDIILPKESPQLAEFLGVMLGDGHISHFQTIVTLGTKELPYVRYVQNLMQELFQVPAKISIKNTGYRDVYIGSTLITRWLKAQGLVENKVRDQVGVPSWIFTNKKFMSQFVRGFFDTDGSVYALRFGIQLSFTNHSVPLLHSLHSMLLKLGYKPSAVGKYSFYLTRRPDIERFFCEVCPANDKHVRRYRKIKLRRYPSG